MHQHALFHLRAIALLLLTAGAAARNDALAEEPDQTSAAEAAVRKVIADYVAAFNERDSAAIAAMWEEQGVYVDKHSAERIVGREAIRDDLKRLFDESGDLSLRGRVDDIRFIRPDVAEVHGQAVTIRPGRQPNDTLFTAIFVRDGERWLIDSIQEEVIVPPAGPGEQLQDLEFLIGQWVDDTDDARVDTTVRWGANRSFLVRSYTVDRGEGTPHQGTQIIGWDPRSGQIRCWMFDSDGSFGEGTWTASDNGWVVKIRQTLPDGRVAGSTQVITIEDENTLAVKSVGEEVEGDAAPASDPVRVVRVSVGGASDN